MKAITTREDAINFIHGCILFIGPGFHPDTPMGGYVTGNDFPLLNTGAAIHYTHLLADCHDMLGEDIYQVGLELMQKLGYAPAPTEAAGNETKEVDWNAEATRLSEMQEKAVQYLGSNVLFGEDAIEIEDFPYKYVYAVGNILAVANSHSDIGLKVDGMDVIKLAACVQKAIAERNPQP